MANKEVDPVSAAEHIQEYIDKKALFNVFNSSDVLIEVLKNANLSIDQGMYVFKEAKKYIKDSDRFDFICACKIDLGNNNRKVCELINAVYKIMRFDLFKKLFYLIYKLDKHLADNTNKLLKTTSELDNAKNLLSQQNETIARLEHAQQMNQEKSQEKENANNNNAIEEQGIIALSNKIVELQQTIDVLRKQANQHNEEKEDLKTEIAEKDNKIAYMTERLKAFESQILEGNNVVSKLRESLMAKDNEICALKQNGGGGLDIITKLRESVVTKDNEISNLRQTLANNHEEMNNMRAAMTELEYQLQVVKEAAANPINTQIEELNKCRKDRKDFPKIYKILDSCVKDNNKDAVRHCIQGNYHEIRDENGNNMILWAAYNANLPLVKLLHECGADIRSRARDGYTVLHSFSHSNCVDGVKYSMQYIDVNDCDNIYKWTPLFDAAIVGSIDVCEFLCQLSAVKKNQKNSDGITPLKMAMICRRNKTAEVLKKYGCTE